VRSQAVLLVLHKELQKSLDWEELITTVMKLAQSKHNCLDLRRFWISPYCCTGGTNPLHLPIIKGESWKTDKTFCCLAPINVGVGSSPSALQHAWKSWPPWSLQISWGQGIGESEKDSGQIFSRWKPVLLNWSQGSHTELHQSSFGP